MSSYKMDLTEFKRKMSEFETVIKKELAPDVLDVTGKILKKKAVSVAKKELRDSWRGIYIDSFKTEQSGKSVRLFNDAKDPFNGFMYADIIERGAKKDYFVPFFHEGSITSLAIYMVDKHGWDIDEDRGIGGLGKNVYLKSPGGEPFAGILMTPDKQRPHRIIFKTYVRSQSEIAKAIRKIIDAKIKKVFG